MAEQPSEPVKRTGMRFMTKVKIVVALVFFAVVLVLVLVNNRTTATVDLVFGEQQEVPTAYLVAGSAAVGFLLGFLSRSFWLRRSRR